MTAHTLGAQAFARWRSWRGGRGRGTGGRRVGHNATEVETHWLRVVILFDAMKAREAHIPVGEVWHFAREIGDADLHYSLPESIRESVSSSL